MHERLPKRLQERVAEASRGAGSRLLDDEVEGLRADHVRNRAREDLDRFLAARSRDDEGRSGAAEGVPALVEAAREHRIDELLVIQDAPDTHREVWIGEDADQVAVRRTELTTLGEQNSWSARADDALLRSAVMTGAPAISVTPVLPRKPRRRRRWADWVRCCAGSDPGGGPGSPAGPPSPAGQRARSTRRSSQTGSGVSRTRPSLPKTR
ncbi:hypothetical protein STENM223S_00567 [Streptomyces tendae]